MVLYFCLFACTTTRNDVVTQCGPEAGRILAYLRQKNNNLGSFKGIGLLRITGRKGEAQTVRIVWMGSQPGNLRVETLGVWGQPTLTLLLKGSDFYVHNHQENRYYKGKGNIRNMSRLMSVPVSAKELFFLLSGQPPVLAFHNAKVETSRHDGQRSLCLYQTRNRLIERVWFKDDYTTVGRVDLFNRSRNPRYTIEFKEFEQVDGFVIPYKTVVTSRKGPVLTLNVERFWRKVPIPARAYTLDFSDAEVVDLDP